MSDLLISTMTAASALGGTEIAHFYQGSNSRKVTIDQIKTYVNATALDINGQTEDTSPDVTADFVITWDVSASAFKKVKLYRVSGGKQTIWMPAAAMTANTTNGPAAAAAAEMTTNKNMVVTMDFDATTQEFAQFEVFMPKGWDLGTVTFIPVWSHASTTTNFGVVWGCDAVAISDGDALDVAFGTAQTSTDTGGTTNTKYIGPESSAITIAGSPAAGDTVQFRIHRDPANGSDTMAIDARLHGVKIIYNTTVGADN